MKKAEERVNRKSFRIKLFIWIGMMALFFSCFCGCYGKNTRTTADMAKMGEEIGVKVTFFDVGKGDAILIETAGHRMLIDAGYDDTVGVILDYLREKGVKKLDYMVITHFDKDHVGGADRILEAVEVGEVLQPDYESDSKQYLEYVEMVERKEMRPVMVTETMRIYLDGAEFLVYPPRSKEYEEEDNDFSLVISMVYGERSFLFTGDCEKERLEELLEQKEFDLCHNVLKVPHHGRKGENSEEFLKAVSPEIAVITCSEDKPADDGILRMLDGMGTEVYQSVDGTVVCWSDGEKIACGY